MRTLIYGKYYHITGDIEVVYENGLLLPVTLDLKDNWGIMVEQDFVPLGTFEVEGVTWFFTNDYQEIAIREFVRDILPGLGFYPGEIEWFKTVPSGVHEVSYHVYFKLKNPQSYQAEFIMAASELELLRNLLFYGSREELELHYGNLFLKTDGHTLYIGREIEGARLYTHVEESMPEDLSDAIEMRDLFATHAAEVEVYYFKGWVFYKHKKARRYHIDYSNTSERSNSLSGMERRILKASKHA